jgi:hypothetical protein
VCCKERNLLGLEELEEMDGHFEVSAKAVDFSDDDRVNLFLVDRSDQVSEPRPEFLRSRFEGVYPLLGWEFPGQVSVEKHNGGWKSLRGSKVAPILDLLVDTNRCVARIIPAYPGVNRRLLNTGLRIAPRHSMLLP